MINAVIRPVVERYLERIEQRLAEAGIEAKLLVMQSSGGVFSSKAAARRPVFMVESGPAAGVIAAAYLGSTIDRPDILSFDMGGTTAKVGLIQDGQPLVTKDYQVGGHASAGIGGLSLSGYPVRTPVVDLVEIGAGGGSIAWVDSGGLLRVGPQSASQLSRTRTSSSAGSTRSTSSGARSSSTSTAPGARSRSAARSRSLSTSSRLRTGSSRSRTPRWSTRSI